MADYEELWYRLEAEDCHRRHKRGRGRPVQVIFVYAASRSQALERFRGMPGVPRRNHPKIRMLDEDEAGILERDIEGNRRITLDKARGTYMRYDGRGAPPPV